jgi:ketosteroid isomerase-like protein
MRTYYLLAYCLMTCFACHQNPPLHDEAAANEKIIHIYFTYFNQHRWTEMASLYADSVEMRDPSIGPNLVHMLRADIIEKYKSLGHALPDVRDSIANEYYSGDNVVVEFISKATGPDGKKFELPICTIFAIHDGKITKDLTYYDNF